MKKIITVGILAVCLIIGTLTISAFTNDYMDNNRFDSAHVYRINENGQTYGSAMYASSPDKEPDLILAEGIDGTEGYVYASDLNEDLPKNPEELLSSTAKNREIWDNAPAGQVVIARTIPLYDDDGETVIGEFPITIGFKHMDSQEFPGSLNSQEFPDSLQK